MKPKIEATSFGSITIDGQRFKKDVIIRLDGSVKKRKKKLSKRIYGTSHTVSLDEAKHVYQEGAELLIIGTGQYDLVRLSEEAQAYLEKHNCRTELAATPDAIAVWNEAAGVEGDRPRVIGLFHVTC